MRVCKCTSQQCCSASKLITDTGYFVWQMHFSASLMGKEKLGALPPALGW